MLDNTKIIDAEIVKEIHERQGYEEEDLADCAVEIVKKNFGMDGTNEISDGEAALALFGELIEPAKLLQVRLS